MEPRSPGARSWIVWVAGTAAGWAIGGMVADVMLYRLQVTALQQGLQSLPESGGLSIPGVTALVAGVLVGFVQSRVLRRRIERAGWRWVGASTLGYVTTVRMMGLGAIFMSALQWLVLRHQVPRAGWWIAGGTLAWLAGHAVTTALLSGGQITQTLSSGAGGLTSGVVSGVVMVRLLRQPAADVTASSPPPGQDEAPR